LLKLAQPIYRVVRQTVGKTDMSVFVKHFISDSGWNISASVSSRLYFLSLLRVCEEAKCQLEKLIKHPLQGPKLLTRIGKSRSKSSKAIGFGCGWALLV
jgi:hypothetical protein